MQKYAINDSEESRSDRDQIIKKEDLAEMQDNLKCIESQKPANPLMDRDY